MKTLIQASTLNALMLGNFDETVSVRDFLHHADTGINGVTGGVHHDFLAVDQNIAGGGLEQTVELVHQG